MSDDQLERRLRAALRTEAEGQPFTITEAELVRRLALRRRGRWNRPAGLLLAAAIGVGLVGAGAIAGGWLDGHEMTVPTAPPSHLAQASAPTPDPSLLVLPSGLPTIDQLIAEGGGEDHLELAQSNGPGDGPAAEPNGLALDPPQLTFGPFPAGDYRIAFGCLGEAKAGFQLREMSSLGLGPIPRGACDGTIAVTDGHLGGSGLFLVALDQRASWRVTVHRIGPPIAIATAGHDVPEPASDDAGFITRTDLGPSDGAPGDFVDVGIPTREWYSVDMACSDAQTVRYGFGEDLDGVRTMSTTVVVPCDGAIHESTIALGELLGSRLSVQPATASVSVLVRSARPAIQVADDRPGWQMSSALGPTYVSRAEAQGTSLVAHEKRGPVLVVIGCAGAGRITGTIDLGVVEGERVIPFTSTCTPNGTEFEHSYVVDGPNVTVYYTAPIRSFVVITALEPKPSP